MREILFLQQELARARQECQAAVDREWRLFRELRESGRCDHSVTEPYVHTRGDGYGRTQTINGRRCCYCLYVDLWGNGNFSDPNTWTSNNDD